MNSVERISLEGKDNSVFVKSRHGLYMETFKDKSKPTVFISKGEYLYIKSLKEIMDRQPWYLRLLLRFNQFNLIESLYFKLSI